MLNVIRPGQFADHESSQSRVRGNGDIDCSHCSHDRGTCGFQAFGWRDSPTRLTLHGQSVRLSAQLSQPPLLIVIGISLGIANGWNFAYSMAISAPAEIVAASSLVACAPQTLLGATLRADDLAFAVWRPDLNLAIFISVFMVVIVTANLFSVRVYGEVRQTSRSLC